MSGPWDPPPPPQDDGPHPGPWEEAEREHQREADQGETPSADEETAHRAAMTAAVAIQKTDFLAAARANRRDTFLLLLLLTLIAGGLGYLLGWTIQAEFVPPDYNAPQPAGILFLSSYGLWIATGLAAASTLWSLFTVWRGDSLVLSMTDGHEVTPEEEPRLHNVVEEMALAAGLPKPRVYVIETDAMNAFATGMRPQRASIAVTRGLLQNLNREELQGVIGHEMGHIANWDTRYMTAVGVTVGLIALLSNMIARGMYFGGSSRSSNRRGGGGGILVVILIVFAILAPIFAKLVQLAVSRQREYLADATSVRFTRNPAGLISALQRLDEAAKPFPGVSDATQHLFIVNPLRRFGVKASALFATHPATEQRIERLRNLGG